MTIADWLVKAMVALKESDVPNGRTDALVLLSDLTNKDKSWIHAHPEHELNDLEVRELDYKLKKRTSHLPLAYIRGYAPFYGRNFTVNKKVLIPRPESESFIEILKSLEFERARIADIGTGSGILGITAALELPDSSIDLYDIDPDALGMAYHNARLYDLDLKYFKSDLLDGLSDDNYDIILANLPYVPDKLITSPEITKEPKIALFAGPDGLDIYRKFWRSLGRLFNKPKYVLTESLESQHLDIQKMASSAGYTLERTDTLVQLFKL